LIFPDSSSRSSQAAPLAEAILISSNSSIQPVPGTPNLFTSISQDSSLVFSVPFDQLPDFVKEAQEIEALTTSEDGAEQKKWIMKAARNSGKGSRRAVQVWLTDAWSSFVDLIKV
jgi:hydroxymethylglutaryl-CoA reductase (NADPH)